MHRTARRFDSRGKREGPQDFGTGRTCAYPECRTVLSRYAKGELCWQHERSRWPLPRP